MKTLITALMLSFISVGAHATVERDVETDCTLDFAQSATVEKIRLLSATDEVILFYRDGTQETAKPVERRNAGIFGDQNFSANLIWTNGQVFVPATRAGDLYVQYRCFLNPTISFDRCISQASLETAAYAGVKMNLGGRVLQFFGANVCRRTDRSPTN